MVTGLFHAGMSGMGQPLFYVFAVVAVFAVGFLAGRSHAKWGGDL